MVDIREEEDQTVDEFGRIKYNPNPSSKIRKKNTINNIQQEGLSLLSKMKAKLQFKAENIETSEQDILQEERSRECEDGSQLVIDLFLENEIQQRKDVRQKLESEIETNQELLQKEQIFQIEIESMVTNLTQGYKDQKRVLIQKIQALYCAQFQLENEIQKRNVLQQGFDNLTQEYQDNQQLLAETIQAINRTQIQLENEIKQRKEMQLVLDDTTKTTRQLEQKYELEHNEKKAKILEIVEEKGYLLEVQKRLNQTQEEVIQSRNELERINQNLTSTSASLIEIQNEHRSLRKLGKKMLTLSKNRIMKRSPLRKKK